MFDCIGNKEIKNSWTDANSHQQETVCFKTSRSTYYFVFTYPMLWAFPWRTCSLWAMHSKISKHIWLDIKRIFHILGITHDLCFKRICRSIYPLLTYKGSVHLFFDPYNMYFSMNIQNTHIRRTSYYLKSLIDCWLRIYSYS